MQKGARPYLHQWNNFGQDFKERKSPIQRRSPRKKLCVQTDNVEDLGDFQIDDSQLIDCDMESVEKDQQEAELLLRLRN